MKRLIKILFFSVFAFVLSMSFGMVSTDALESYVIGEDVDFANSLGQGYIDTVLQADGKIKTTLNTAIPSRVRMYYAADGAEQYRVNLNDFTFNYTIDTMETNASYKIAFLKNWDDFPLDKWGTGLAFLMRDDNGGAYYVDPYLYTGGVGQQKIKDKCYYLVYQNSPRVSHLGKSITFRSQDAGDKLLITMKFDEATGSPVTYGNYFPKSYFTERGMDVTSVLFMFGVNHNNSVDFEFTINEISDSNKAAYNTAYGNVARTLFAEVDAIDPINPDDSIAAIHRFYHLPEELDSTSNLRKSDRYLKTQAINKWNSLKATYVGIVADKKVDLFGMYDAAFEVTAENLESVKSSLLVYNSTKIDLNDAELDGRMEQLTLKVVALNNDNISVKDTLKLDGVVQGTPTSVTKCVGGTYTPDLSAVEGTFMFWTVNGAVRTDLPQDYTFKVTSKLELVAHFASTGKYSVAYLDANTKLIDVEYVDDTGVLTPPTLESTP
ncbi:MAG: hypothetical protein GX931_04050 [Acholeplasmataceae bacterium]|nr:hypothetical protein [Acholeplasmataceae bacterium]